LGDASSFELSLRVIESGERLELTSATWSVNEQRRETDKVRSMVLGEIPASYVDFEASSASLVLLFHWLLFVVGHLSCTLVGRRRFAKIEYLSWKVPEITDFLATFQVHPWTDFDLS
jgi:hypothetical protein